MTGVVAQIQAAAAREKRCRALVACATGTEPASSLGLLADLLARLEAEVSSGRCALRRATWHCLLEQRERIRLHVQARESASVEVWP